MRINIILLVLTTLVSLTSCRSRKVTTENYQKSTIIEDSLSVKTSKIQNIEIYQEKKDTLINDFEITFQPDEQGEIILETPAGRFKATKSGNGSVKFSSTQKSADITHRENNIKIDSTTNHSEKTNTSESLQKSQEKTIIKPWYIRIWYVWVFLLLVIILKFAFKFPV